jgi:hypothetical protein
MKKILTVLMAVIIFCSCSKLDKKYSTETYLADIQEIRKEYTTGSSLIDGYVKKSIFKGTNLSDMTYEEIWDKAIEEQVKKKEIERIEKEIERIEMMKKIVNVSITDKRLIRQDYSEDMAYNMIFENLSDKDIIAIKGKVVITDIFGEEIKSLNIKYDKTITAKGKYEGDYIYDWTRFSNEDNILNSKEIKDLKFVWKPENITFSDGTTPFYMGGGC